MEFIQNLLIMDGQGKYVWFVLLVFLIVIFLNYYLPYRTIRKIQEENSQSSEE
jgi:hypothetical protein